MSRVIECPGCHSRLKIQSDSSSISCPACRTTFAAPELATLVDDDVDDVQEYIESGDDNAPYIDEDTIRAKKESLLILGLMAVVTVIALIAFPSGIYYLFSDNNTEDVAEAVPQEVTAEPSADIPDATPADRPPAEAQSAAALKPSAPPDASVNTSSPLVAENDHSAPQPVSPSDDTPPAASAALPQAPATQASGPTVTAIPIIKKQPPADAEVMPRDGSAKTADTKPVDEVAKAGRSDETDATHQELRYRWKSGDQHVYALKITAKHGSSQQTISGSCTYTVKSDGTKKTQEKEGSGTGFVISADGYLATCDHVVAGAKTIEVVIGEKTYVAKPVARNKKQDLAIIKIDAAELPVVEFADSDKVKLAETVRAFGFPLSQVLGTGIKVATGAVAGIVIDPVHGRQIQTDAPVNPGNSGGPIVNESGQVLGVTSSKIASSRASSVGFAVPINALVQMMKDNNLQPNSVKDLPKLKGTVLAENVTPSVAFIKVSGTGDSSIYDVDFTASFTENTSFDSRQFRFGGLPTIPSSTFDRGKLKIDEFGQLSEFSGDGSLPYVLGPIGQLFLTPLTSYNETTWDEDHDTTLRIIKRSNDPVSRLRGQMSRMRGGFGPGGRGGMPRLPDLPGFGPEDETMETIPAVVHTSYTRQSTEDGVVTIQKDYEFSTTRDTEEPYLTVKGSGKILFDTRIGMPVGLDYSATVTKNENSVTTTLPITVTYNLRDPADVKKEQDEARRRAAERKQQAEEKRTIPNPDAISDLLTKITEANGQISVLSHLQGLTKLAVVPEFRERVLVMAAEHRDHENGFVRGSAAEIFCLWSTQDTVADLWEILQSDDSLLATAQKKAIARVVEIKPNDLYPNLILLMQNSRLRSEIKTQLVAAGSEVEPHILTAFDAVQDRTARRYLLDVLNDVGTETSLAKLKELATGSDSLLRSNAQRAIDAIRKRENLN